jgi:octaprenyl-diphosphate synthase
LEHEKSSEAAKPMNENASVGSWDAFGRKIDEYRVRVDKALLAELHRRKDSVFYEPVRQALNGGKRMRPILLVLSSESIGRRNADPLPAAVAVELAHTESLIHDDINDRDRLRRATATFHTSYGEDMALLSADFILSIILDVVTRDVDTRVPQVLGRAISQMCEGELEELAAYKRGLNLKEDEYVNIISRKTASLFEASAAIGAIIAGADKDEVKALSDYGRCLGIAYQIQDDIADREKPTTVDIQSLVSPRAGESRSFQRLSNMYVRQAQVALEGLGPNKATALLVQLADFTTSSAIKRI